MTFIGILLAALVLGPVTLAMSLCVYDMVTDPIDRVERILGVMMGICAAGLDIAVVGGLVEGIL